MKFCKMLIEGEGVVNKREGKNLVGKHKLAIFAALKKDNKVLKIFHKSKAGVKPEKTGKNILTEC